MSQVFLVWQHLDNARCPGISETTGEVVACTKGTGKWFPVGLHQVGPRVVKYISLILIFGCGTHGHCTSGSNLTEPQVAWIRTARHLAQRFHNVRQVDLRYLLDYIVNEKQLDALGR